MFARWQDPRWDHASRHDGRSDHGTATADELGQVTDDTSTDTGTNFHPEHNISIYFNFGKIKSQDKIIDPEDQDKERKIINTYQMDALLAAALFSPFAWRMKVV